MDRSKMESAIIRELCQWQTIEYAYGEDSVGNSTEIRWIGDAWQTIDIQDGEKFISYDNLDEVIPNLYDGVIVDMFERLELELEEVDAV